MFLKKGLKLFPRTLCHDKCIDIFEALPQHHDMKINNKTVHLQLRISPEEKAMIARAAKRANLSMSTWIMNKILPPQKNQFYELVKALHTSEDKSYVYAQLNDLLYKLSPTQFTETVAVTPGIRLTAYDENYLAAMVEYAAVQKGVPPPVWTRDIPPLQQPVFGTDLKSLRMHLLTHSPCAFRRRNIFIDATLGDRV